jgi:hypothetical protein
LSLQSVIEEGQHAYNYLNNLSNPPKKSPQSRESLEGGDPAYQSGDKPASDIWKYPSLRDAQYAEVNPGSGDLTIAFLSEDIVTLRDNSIRVNPLKRGAYVI